MRDPKEFLNFIEEEMNAGERDQNLGQITEHAYFILDYFDKKNVSNKVGLYSLFMVLVACLEELMGEK